MTNRMIYIFIFISGMAALSWEVLWQVRSTLALGISAWGTAITLAVTMGGMSLGALLAGHFLKDKALSRPLRIYGILECIIGIAGLLLGPAFHMLETIDAGVYATLDHGSPLVRIIGIICVLGLPTMAMGATLPVLGLIGKQFRTSIATLYGLNTLGAAFGVLIAAFVLIPLLGLNGLSLLIALLNLSVGVLAWIQPPGPVVGVDDRHDLPVTANMNYTLASVLVFVTGFATFSLEVAWFRSLRAAFMSTTDAFAIMLASVLISLGIGAWIVPTLKKIKLPVGMLLGASGILILLATPLIERFDVYAQILAVEPYILFFQWFSMSLYVIGPPMVLLGIVLPWILDNQTGTKHWGFLYGLNAMAAIFGALVTAWIFLPTFGFAKTSWLVGVMVAGVGLIAAPPGKSRVLIMSCATIALMVAVVFESGVGTKRVQGNKNKIVPAKILQAYEGPDVTTTAVEYSTGERLLFIDGFVATAQAEQGKTATGAHYMKWMGHLPMLLHPNPKNALVICFGTGQTSNGVRNENPDSLDIVDINANVFKLGHFFTRNEGVLNDKRVHTTVMDGRAYIRRTNKTYDIITLEPMAPSFAGVNALYSREFYQQARERLGPDGIIAQWVPFHLLSPEYAAAVTETFRSVFPNSILWLDPQATDTGIIVGTVNDKIRFGAEWPGFNRQANGRDLSQAEVRGSILLDQEGLKKYGEKARIITDDNQLLAYGKAAYMMRDVRGLNPSQWHDLLRKGPAPAKSP